MLVLSFASNGRGADTATALVRYSTVIPAPMRDELPALVRGHLIFLARERNGCLLIRSIEDDADEFHSLDVIDSAGMTLLYGWPLGHQCNGRRRRAT